MNDTLIVTPVQSLEGSPWQNYLIQHLISLRTQNYPGFYCVVVNDGSTDNLSDVIKEFAKVDPRIIEVRQRNTGYSRAANNGIKVALSPFSFENNDEIEVKREDLEKLAQAGIRYATTSAADDLFTADGISRRRDYFEASKEKIGWVLGKLAAFTHDPYQSEVQNVPSPDNVHEFYKRLFMMENFAPQMVLWHIEFLKAVMESRKGLYDESAASGEGWEAALQAAETAIYRGYSIKLLDFVCCYKRLHDKAVTHANKANGRYFADRRKTLLRHLPSYFAITNQANPSL